MAEPPSKRPRRGYPDEHSAAPPRRDDRPGRRDPTSRDRRSRSPARRDRPSGRRDRSTSRDRGNRRRDDTRARSPPPRGADRDRDSRRRSPPPSGPRGAPSGPRNGAHAPFNNRKSQNGTQDADAAKPAVQAPDDMDVDGTEEDAEEALMRKMMGFAKFKTTKNSKVPGNDKNYGVRKEKKVEYRQYMNRVGGFNRPLSPSR